MVNSPGFGCAFVSLIPLTHFNLNFQVLQRESNRLSNLPESPTNWVWVWRREWKVWETGRLVRSLMLAHFTLFRSPPLVHSLIEWNHHERNVGAEWWVRSLARLRSVHSPTVHSLSLPYELSYWFLSEGNRENWAVEQYEREKVREVTEQ